MLATQTFQPAQPAERAQPITVHLKTLSGKTISVRSPPHLPISQVVEAECFRQFVVHDDTAVRLIHAGRQLDPNNSLQQYHIGDDHTIHVVFTRRQSERLVEEENRWALERLRQHHQQELPCRPSRPRNLVVPVDIQEVMIFAAREAGAKYWPADPTAPTPETIAHELALALFAKAAASQDEAMSLHFSLPPRLDMVWHHFLLETQPYAEFCRRVTGLFLPHTARTVNDPDELKNARIAVLLVMRRQIPNFGEPNAWCWSNGQAGQDRQVAYAAEQPIARRTRRQCRQQPEVNQSNEVNQVSMANQHGDGGFEIFVKMINGKTETYRVRGEMTAIALKQMIYWRNGFPCDSFRLIFSGTNLPNDECIADYNVTQCSTLHLVQMLRGC
jgi:hypothetical protein